MTLAETRKDYLAELTRVPLLIIDDLGMRKLPHTAAEDLLELIMRVIVDRPVRGEHRGGPLVAAAGSCPTMPNHRHRATGHHTAWPSWAALVILSLEEPRHEPARGYPA